MLKISSIKIKSRRYLFGMFLLIYFFKCTNASFAQDCLNAHNRFRRDHGVPDLKLDSKLQKAAHKHAQKLAERGQIFPSDDENIGENIYMSKDLGVDAGEAVSTFYHDNNGYRFNTKATKENRENAFTQVIWKSSKRLGCDFAQNGNDVFVVAMYDPRGNVIGKFQDNVFPSNGSKYQNVLENPENNDNSGSNNKGIVVMKPLFLDFAKASFGQECLNAHNKFRRDHGVPDLELDLKLQEAAHKHAQKLAEKDEIFPSGDENIGENIYMSKGLEVDAAVAVKDFYENNDGYVFNTRVTKESVRNPFTQVIWKNSKRLGCDFAKSGNKVFVVAMYDPRGNIRGKFKDNVLRARVPLFDRRNELDNEENNNKTLQFKTTRPPPKAVPHNKNVPPYNRFVPLLNRGIVKKPFLLYYGIFLIFLSQNALKN